jgi:hypothetical protein
VSNHLTNVQHISGSKHSEILLAFALFSLFACNLQKDNIAKKTESHGSDKEARLHNLYGDQIDEDDMGRTCSKYGRDKNCIQAFWPGDLK